LVGKLEAEILFGICRGKNEKDFVMQSEKARFKDVDCINLGHNQDQLWALANMALFKLLGSS
jgi:hypothetical protein